MMKNIIPLILTIFFMSLSFSSLLYVDERFFLSAQSSEALVANHTFVFINPDKREVECYLLYRVSHELIPYFYTPHNISQIHNYSDVIIFEIPINFSDRYFKLSMSYQVLNSTAAKFYLKPDIKSCMNITRAYYQYILYNSSFYDVYQEEFFFSEDSSAVRKFEVSASPSGEYLLIKRISKPDSPSYEDEVLLSQQTSSVREEKKINEFFYILLVVVFLGIVIIAQRVYTQFKSYRTPQSHTRIEILMLLNKAPRTVTDLSNLTGKAKSTISEHLELMLSEGLIEKDEKDGRKHVYYKLSQQGKLFLIRNSFVLKGEGKTS